MNFRKVLILFIPIICLAALIFFITPTTPQSNVEPKPSAPAILGWTTNCLYIGATGSDWETTTNWNCDGTNRLPTAGDRATIDSTVIVNINAPTTVDDLVLGDSSGTYSPTLNFDYDAITLGALIVDESDLTVYSGATITHTQGTTAVVGNVFIDVQTGNATINGTINVKAKGYAASEGPGQGTNGNGSGGAGYGGEGGNDYYANTPGGVSYGSLITPEQLGSGGGIDVVGAKGGGAVKLDIAGSLTLTGNINADGQDNPGTGSNDAGGGSGGSIYIIANTLIGAGTLTSNGSNGYRYGGAGAGGRIAVYYNTNSSTFTMTAYGGIAGNLGGYIASAGTIYLNEAASTFTSVKIDNNDRESGIKKTPLTSGDSFSALTISNKGYLNCTYPLTITTLNLVEEGKLQSESTCNITYSTFNWATGGIFLDRGGTFSMISGAGDLVVPAGAVLFADTTRSYTNVTVGGTITNSVNGATPTYNIRHTITGGGTYSISAGGSINVDGKGYSGGNGPCQGLDGNGASGGGHGGEGGDSNVVQGGGMCGSLTAPEDWGSGGGVDGTSSPGGGSIKIDVTGGVFNLLGTISANGISNAVSTSDAGGGAGGSVYIITGSLTGSGSISTNGGPGGNFGQVAGAGGGGRIAVYYTTDTSTITYNSSTGSTNNSTSIYGAAGTIYLEQSGGTKVVTIDNNNRNSNGNVTELPNNLSITTLNIDHYGYFRSNTNLTTNTINLKNNSTLFLNSLANITYSAYTWESGGEIIDRGGTFAILSGGGDLTVPTTAILFADSARSYTNVTVDGTITHSTNSASKTYYIDHTVSGNYTINIGGLINTQGKGYAASQGPGQGTDGNGAGGAGHGGEGGNDAFANTPGGGVYDSITAPIDLGSGGGLDGPLSSAGGGAVKLSVGGTLTVNGTINVNGQVNPGSGNDDTGGGSGGSIYLTSNTLVGNGYLKADGANGYRYGGAGAGGRIALYYTTDSSTLNITAYGGAQGNLGGNISAAGTIYYQSTAGVTSLKVDNNNLNSGLKTTNITGTLTIDTLNINNRGSVGGTSATITATTINMANNAVYYNNTGTTLTYTNLNWTTGSTIYDKGGTFALLSSGGALSVPTGTFLYADTQRSYTSVTIDGTLTHTANTTTETYKIHQIVSGNYTINSGGAIDVQSKGYISSEGTGQGADSTSGSGGAGHGGIGGAGSVGAGGTTYDTETAPINIGSGGGADGAGNGGKGGGAVFLDIQGNVTVNGNILANAGNYVSLDSGGGSGGSIYIISAAFSGNGIIQAKGGNGNATTGGGGGGGRIAIYYSSWGWTGSVLSTAVATAGGTGRNAGVVGTVYLGTTNSAPTMSSVSIDSGAVSINLTENTTTNVICSGVATDLDSYLDIDYVTGILFRTSIGAGAADNDNNHYTKSTDTQCVPSGGSGSSETYTCTFAVYFHAEPTDIGSLYESDDWTCQITPYDGAGAGSAGIDTIEMSTLRGLAVPSTLTYGEVNPGSNTVGDITSTISNTGNCSIDLELYGANMCTNYPTCNEFTIPVSKQEFATASFTYGTGTDLSTSPLGVQTNLPKANTHPSNSTFTVYWGIGIDPTQKVGLYQGQNVFTAVADN